MASSKDTPDASAAGPPEILLQEAHAAAAAAQDDRSNLNRTPIGERHDRHHHSVSSHLGEVPPPPYNGADYGQLDISQNGLDTGAKLASDGRVNININQRSHKLSNLLVPALRKQLELAQQEPEIEPEIPAGLGGAPGTNVPPMNIVIQIVGSRGDVQPFVALGQVLKNKYNHRVRIATHPTFRQFVTENGLEFFSIGGDPAELMAFMVKNPGLMPGMDSLKNGDVGKRRKGIYEIITGCWRSCIEAGDGTGREASDDLLDGRSFDSAISLGDPTVKPFVADAIIANPPSFAHMHIAEKLGIPLHLMFTMPWSPTQSFPHPLANIVSSNTDANMANFVTYALVDMLTWQGLGDVINKFRERSLGLEPVSIMWAPGMASRLRVPWTYCWSPALIPKPLDWGNYIDISGFYFLNLATNFTPDPDLAEFLAAGPPPVYIGFGSIVVDDPNAMTKMIFEAVQKTGQRALVSKGWGGLGADQLGKPDGIYMLGNIPHDWLFKHVSCVVHHGGAGTTAAGISAGRPTVVVPFFGDQPFWGAMCARAGAGPMPIAYKNLTADKLAHQITEALKPESLERAKELSEKIRSEKGTEEGARSFHKQLHLSTLRCSLCPDRVAVWRIKRTDIRLSALAAIVLGNEGLLEFSDLKLYRPREYETEDGPWDPISGGAAALIGTFGNLAMGIADFPVEILKSLKLASNDIKEAHEKDKNSPAGGTTPIASSRHGSTTEVSKAPTEAPKGASSDVASRDLTPVTTATSVTEKPVVDSTVLSRESTVGSTNQDASDDRRLSAISTVLSQTGEHHRHRHFSHDASHSPHRSYSRHDSSAHEPNPAEDIGHITLESAIGGAKAAHKIVAAGVKSPMDFTLSLAKGFHNAPKLYGDDTVRKTEKVTDLQSGLKVAGKEFGYGFFDGITGLVTQPLAGARKEGAAGFFKGAAKGIGGLILKPGAAVWGLPGYTTKGIYAEISKHFGNSVQNYIIAARTAQGYDEWKESTPEERVNIVAAWKSSQLETKRAGKKYGKEKTEEIESHILTRTNTDSVELMHGFANTRHLTWDERKALDKRRKQMKKEQKEMKRRESEAQKPERKESKANGGHNLRQVSTFPSPDSPASYGRSMSREATHDEFEEAIKKAVATTSKGNPEEDAMIERAIRASVKELQKAKTQEEDSEAYKRAIQASIDEAKKHRAETAQETGTLPLNPDDHEHELEKALNKSLEEYKIREQPHEQHHMEDSDSGLGTDEDEEFKRTIEESKRLHTERENERKLRAEQGGKETNPSATQDTKDNADDDDHDMKEAMTASQKHHDDLQRQKTEEDIVMEYVKKQSLLEQEHANAKNPAT